MKVIVIREKTWLPWADHVFYGTNNGNLDIPPPNYFCGVYRGHLMLSVGRWDGMLKKCYDVNYFHISWLIVLNLVCMFTNKCECA